MNIKKIRAELSRLGFKENTHEYPSDRLNQYWENWLHPCGLQMGFKIKPLNDNLQTFWMSYRGGEVKRIEDWEEFLPTLVTALFGL